MKIDKRDPHHWSLLLQQGAYTLLAILIRLFTRKPRKPIVLLYGHHFSDNLKALHSEWESSCAYGFDLYYLSLDPDYAKQSGMAKVKVLSCNKLMDMLILCRTTALISNHGLHLMSPLVRFTDILFIDVWHGIPFKGFTPTDFRLQHRYNEVWVSSPLLKEVYQRKFDFCPDIVHSLGYARTDKLFRREQPDPSFRTQAAIPTGHRIVLYAPTWRQDHLGREMFPFGECQKAFLQQLSDICDTHMSTLVIRSHQNTSINEESFDNVRYCAMRDYPDTEDLLLHADILICDWSSIVFDFLALDRPAIFLDVQPPFKNGFSLGKEFRFGSVVRDMKALNSELSSILINPQSYFAQYEKKHQEVRHWVYGENTDGCAAQRQLDHLCNLLKIKYSKSSDH